MPATASSHVQRPLKSSHLESGFETYLSVISFHIHRLMHKDFISISTRTLYND